MPGKVLSFSAHHFTQPLFDFRVVDIIVVDPALVARVVGRINVNALDAPLIPGQQCFQGLQIIAPDNHVFAAVIFFMLALLVIAVLALQHPERHFLMVIDDFTFSDPFQCWHGVFLHKSILVKDLSCHGRTYIC